jgi:hypothetical protein
MAMCLPVVEKHAKNIAISKINCTFATDFWHTLMLKVPKIF